MARTQRGRSAQTLKRGGSRSRSGAKRVTSRTGDAIRRTGATAKRAIKGAVRGAKKGAARAMGAGRGASRPGRGGSARAMTSRGAATRKGAGARKSSARAARPAAGKPRRAEPRRAPAARKPAAERAPASRAQEQSREYQIIESSEVIEGGASGAFGGEAEVGGESRSRITTDHDTIRRWAEERGGMPAIARNMESGILGDASDSSVLRILFPGSPEESLDRISWDEFFRTFEERNLAMIYEDTTSEGDTSRFVKFVDRDEARMNA